MDANPVRDNAPHADHAVGQSRGDEPEAGTLDDADSTMDVDDHSSTFEHVEAPGFIHFDSDGSGLDVPQPKPIYDKKKQIHYVYTKEFINGPKMSRVASAGSRQLGGRVRASAFQVGGTVASTERGQPAFPVKSGQRPPPSAASPRLPCPEC
jgi:hypothetical protein